MNNKKIIFGSIVGIAIVALGVMCICMTPGQKEKQESGTGIGIEISDKNEETDSKGKSVREETSEYEDEEVHKDEAVHKETIVYEEGSGYEEETIDVYDMTPEEIAEINNKQGNKSQSEKYEINIEDSRAQNKAEKIEQMEKILFNDSEDDYKTVTISPSNERE